MSLEAIEAVKKALERNPADPLAHAMLSDLYEERGFDDLAMFHRAWSREDYDLAMEWASEFEDLMDIEANFDWRQDLEWRYSSQPEVFDAKWLVEVGKRLIESSGYFIFPFDTPHKCYDAVGYWNFFNYATGGLYQDKIPDVSVDYLETPFGCSC